MLLPIALSIAAPMTGTQSAQTCQASVQLPASLAGWHRIASAPTIGQAFVVAGHDPASVRGLSAADVARGGNAALVPIQIDTGGTYRIALSDASWIDVTTANQVLPSIAHRHGPACSGIRKIVDFKLDSGRYALHLSGMKAASVKVLIERA